MRSMTRTFRSLSPLFPRLTNHRHDGLSITSILVCRFILSLREFDSNVAYSTSRGVGSRIREHTASTVLEFAARSSDTLPPFIASFAHPIHVDSGLSEVDSNISTDDSDLSEWHRIDRDTVGLALDTRPPGQKPYLSSGQSSTPKYLA